jgi:hypothetical protein
MALENSAGEFFVDAAPLFEKEGYFCGEALVANFNDPFRVHWSCARA